MTRPGAGQDKSAFEEKAAALAGSLECEPPPPEKPGVLSTLDELPPWLQKTRLYCRSPLPEQARAADWLLDNDYQVSRAIREIRQDMPPEFYRRLTAARIDGHEKTPRVFAVAHAIVDVARFQLTAALLVEFLSEYQKTAPLTLAELWALPSMLRLASLEILADAFGGMTPVLKPPFEPSAFAVASRQESATDRVSRAITILIAVRSMEWRDIVDQTSAIEALLATDPAGVYAFMDQETRDRYRKAVEEMAESSNVDESAVARAALRLASNAVGKPREHHVGYWLVDAGRRRLEQELGCRITRNERTRRVVMDNAGRYYASALTAFVLIALALPVQHLATRGAGTLAMIAGILFSLLPATVLGTAILNWLITRFTQPRLLPMMDFRKAIPDDCPTCVVVPVIIADAADIPRIVEQLEIRRLSNPDPKLRFVLLTDYTDAPGEHVPGDASIRNGLVAAVRALNERYSEADDRPFFLMHRPRRYNPAQGCWMGWERKRGKLEQFNAFVLGAPSDTFEVCEGDVERLRGTRFVITLDADTALPPASAARLVGIMAHPLNRPVIDPALRKVIQGHAVVQPRIEVLPVQGPVSMFCRLYAGDTAIDIYSRAVSDVYQDLFGSGIFVGKGIYDVAAFRECLEGRIPENAILSHDLFEGLFCRAGLASNIVLYEDFPPAYVEYALRLHRWVRGDWQLLPWLRRQVPARDGSKVRNVLSGLDRWKIADNLRRSLLAPSLLLFFIGGWMVLPGSAWLWTLLAVAAPGAYLVGEIYTIVTREIRRGRLADLAFRFGERVGHWFLTIAFLISDTLISLDAIGRTLWRMLKSRHQLLEWRSAAHVATAMRTASVRTSMWSMMWPSTVLSALLAADLAILDSSALLPAIPVLAMWMFAPEMAVWLGKPRGPRRERLNDDEKAFLTRLARRTWLYFETFAGPEDNWLPPDNFQEVPKAEVAHRTSPTNIGLYLTSAQAAHDSGFIGGSDFAVRMRNALNAMGRCETYRGHILNWYDTRTLTPLEPRYVSTVDSGNLAICLIALRQGCYEAVGGPAIKGQVWGGLACTLDILLAAARALPMADTAELERCETALRQALAGVDAPPESRSAVAGEIAGRLWPELEAAIFASIAEPQDISEGKLAEIHVWNERTGHHIRALQREVDTYVPWERLLANPPQGFRDLAGAVFKLLPPSLALDAAQEQAARALTAIEHAAEQADGASGPGLWLKELREAIAFGAANQSTLRRELLEIAADADALAYGMDFRMLYDTEVRLFRIGYNISTGRIDANHYDLLATEARLASFFAIAKHDVPIEHWFALGRPVTRLEGKPSVLSWNGSMFEYLMPTLFLPGQRDTLLGESESTAVEHQRAYARERGVPWGISESAFATTDQDGNYQYRAFGVPGLGLRRGLTDDVVIAPYASALALCCWPTAAVQNLQVLRDLGAMGLYGFHDAVDYTRGRLAEGRHFAIVRNYMAHHHGMTIAAIANALDDDVFVRRALAAKRMQTVEMLLQERVPWDAPIEKGRTDEEWKASEKEHAVAPLSPWMPSRAAGAPQMHMLGNGHMASWISESGAGGLFLNEQALTRWLPDTTRDACGYWVYMRDADTGETWSIGRQPAGRAGTDARVVFHQHMVEFFRRDHGIAARMEVTVSSSDDADIREITVTNESDQPRNIEFTSYAEIVLAQPLEDERHPAFSKLFVGSRYLPGHNALLFTRRPRRPESRPPVLLHRLFSDDPAISVTAYETDRARFLGRLGSIRNPAAMTNGLTKTTGWTLDPVMSLQTRLTLEPGETKRFMLLTAAAESRGEVLEIADRHAPLTTERVRRDALRSAAREVARLGIEPQRLPELQVLASLLYLPHPALRQVPAAVSAIRAGQPDLWQFGISGDFPILLLRINDEVPSKLLTLLVKAQRLWRRAGIRADLVVLRSEAAGYEAPLRERILAMLRDADADANLGTPGGIHLLSSGMIAGETLEPIIAAASVVLSDDRVPLAAILDRILEDRAPPPAFVPSGGPPYREIEDVPRPDALAFDNGFGGFEVETADYSIYLPQGQKTPAPWCNVMANDRFGTIVTEAGLGFTFATNSGENRLTPWSNDPVCETPGEVIYLRDEQTGEVWTTTPAPIGASRACQIRHGCGWTRWSRNSNGLEQTLRVFVPVEDPVKIATLTIVNRSGIPRRITATYYAEWLLGALGSRSKPHTVCEYDAAERAILASNAWNPEFADAVAFLTASLPPHSISGNRHDFFGAEGDAASPAGLRQWDLGGGFAAGGDTCAAYQVHIDIAPDATVEVAFALGQGANAAETRALIAKWREPARIETAFADVEKSWSDILRAVEVKTPDPAFDLMINRWLIYQALASRLSARAGFYQAGGAFGYRDQLQDVLALLFADPARVRAHILLAASRQFEEGDVQHWWHPPSGRGVRTRITDDFVWLPYVTARYIEATGDGAILTEKVPFLSAPPLRPGEHDRYAHFDTGSTATLLEHCERALNRMTVTGAHGLPLIGTGDWNDGMDRIGDEGRGESVWLAWFQIATIGRFAPLLEKHGGKEQAAYLKTHAQSLKDAIHAHAWDGEWFVRAFDDEGMAWGSHRNDECQIDAIAQSWAVMSGAGEDRMRVAMASAKARLIDPGRRLVKLLDPPFLATPRDPGYIKAYPAGIRENGGQYTHAAAWMGHAFAGLGNGDDAWQVFDIINPIRRTQTHDAARRYAREPYVLAGDVYGPGQNIGLGGWSWYSGAAGWTWQLGVEAILGLKMENGALRVSPCLPRDWGHAQAQIASPKGVLVIVIDDPDKLGSGALTVTVDGRRHDAARPVTFPGKGKTRKVIVRIKPKPATRKAPGRRELEKGI